MKKKVVAVFGYNNTRLYDVKKIKTILEKQGLGIMLCREGITSEDKEVSQYCFDTKLHGSHQEIERAYIDLKNFILIQNIEIIGVLPFSDRGVLLGSYTAEKMGLISDKYTTAITGLSKYKFREAEVSIETPSWYRKPQFRAVQKVTDILQFYSQITSPVFVKPTSEGNSRGCFLVNSSDDIEIGFQNVLPYLNEGAIVEEYVSNGREFSFDSVAGKCWITEKQITPGHYRAEVQQIVPAPLKKEEYDRLIEAGKWVAKISGSNGGAAHNELFLFSDYTTLTVEPNRRPAGMHIWDMATYAFPNFNPFELWVTWAIGKQFIIPEVLQPDTYVGIRMIQAPINGMLIEIDDASISKIKARAEVIEVSFSKNINEIVLCEPKDNAGFLGYIIAEHKDPKKLKHILMDLCESVVKSLKIVPLQEKKSDFSLIKQLREDADKEQVKVFDCTYIQPFIETWWNQLKYKDNYGKNKEQLKSVLLENFTRGELHQLNKVGVTGYHISAIFMIGLFTVDDPDLAYIVHEALSDLAQIRDIRYPYEDHKKIFIKPEGVQKKEWGNGAGAISPHCDDLYEEEDTDLLSLTTCRDTLKGSTLLFMAKQIFSILSDTEMDRLTKMIAIFISGINVNGTVKEKKRPVLSYKNSNFFMALDYRVDESTGARMRIKDESDLALLEKIKMHLTPDKAMKPKSEVGNFVILSNSKVLHAREALQAVTGLCSLDLDTTPRLLFRSKGPRY